MKIVVGFSRPRNKLLPIFSWLIRLVEGTRYSHVYVRWHSRGADVNICYHASGSQIHFLCNDVFQKCIKPVEEYELNVDVPQYKEILHYCMSNAGKRYGISQVFGIAMARLFRLKKNPLSNGDSRQICSELVSRLLNQVIEIGGPDLNLDLIGPKELNKIVQTTPGMVRTL